MKPGPRRTSGRNRLGPRRQRGAALLTAMIIVTLVVTLASSMVWQQWRAVQVEAAERARAQSAWILGGALEWAKLILRENVRNNQGIDNLGQPWAVPLAESRLSTFLAAEKETTPDDGPEAFLSGAITDAQARFNVTNLVSGGSVDPLALAALSRLCETLSVDTGVANRIATGMLGAIAPQGSASAPTTPTGPTPLLPRSVSQLAWLGIDVATLERLRPYVVVLPDVTETNVNTASREVLAAQIAGLDVGSAERLVQYRQRAPFKSLADFTAQAQLATPPTAKLSVGSRYFEVRGRLRLGDRVLEQRSLVQRGQGGQVNVIESERVSSREEQPAS